LETAVSKRWLRGPALEIILQLDGLEVGDELIALPKDMKESGWKRPGKVVVKEKDNRFIHTTCLCSEGCGSLVIIYKKSVEEIKAWRRP
jgi:hypothetical protein